MNTFAEYEEAALRTAIYPGQGTALGLMYVALKGAGESGEFAAHTITGDEDALKKEIGDELWYCAAKAHELDTTLAGIVGVDDFARLASFARRFGQTNYLAIKGVELATAFAEYVGKALRDDELVTVYREEDATGGMFDSAMLNDLKFERKEQLRENLREHVILLDSKAAVLGTTLGFIAQQNIDKLAKRKAEGKLGGSGDNR